MLESKKKMSQSFSDLKVAVEKGRGNPKEFFQIFEQGCREFAGETNKVPQEYLNTFLDLVRRMGEKIQTGDISAIVQLMDEMRGMKKSCHEAYKK
jgi:XXXCH domain-containing protein